MIGRRRSGFTLIEVVIVLMMIGIAATFVIPRIMGAQTNVRIDTATQQLVMDISRARVEAMARNTSVTLTRTGSNGYTITNLGAHSFDSDIAFVSGSAASITFTSYGTLNPANPATMTVQLGDQTRAVVVSSAGFARVQ